MPRPLALRTQTALFALMGVAFVWTTGVLVFIVIRGVGLLTGRAQPRGWPGEAVLPLMLVLGLVAMWGLWRMARRGAPP